MVVRKIRFYNIVGLYNPIPVVSYDYIWGNTRKKNNIDKIKRLYSLYTYLNYIKYQLINYCKIFKNILNCLGITILIIFFYLKSTILISFKKEKYIKKSCFSLIALFLHVLFLMLLHVLNLKV